VCVTRDKGKVTDMTTLMRLPKHGPVSFSEKDGRLVLSVPLGEGGDNLYRADVLVRKLMDEGEMAFYCETGEPTFVLEQVESRETWDGLIIACAITTEVEHKIDIPGPMNITGRCKENALSLYVRRQIAQRDLDCAQCEEKIPKGKPFKWAQGQGPLHPTCADRIFGNKPS